MSRPNRTYKLQVSASGFDLLVDVHARLTGITRSLMPYGQTLHVSLHHLATLDQKDQVEAIAACPRFALSGGPGGTTIFVGAPKALADLADQVRDRLGSVISSVSLPTKAELYLVALHASRAAGADTMLAAYACVAESSASKIYI
jgi:hypothetical protein